MNLIETRMKFNPVDGSTDLRTTDPSEFRRWFYDSPWRYNPYTGRPRYLLDMDSDPQGFDIKPPEIRVKGWCLPGPGSSAFQRNYHSVQSMNAALMALTQYTPSNQAPALQDQRLVDIPHVKMTFIYGKAIVDMDKIELLRAYGNVTRELYPYRHLKRLNKKVRRKVKELRAACDAISAMLEHRK